MNSGTTLNVKVFSTKHEKHSIKSPKREIINRFDRSSVTPVIANIAKQTSTSIPSCIISSPVFIYYCCPNFARISEIMLRKSSSFEE
jgi:hypothetical protein